MRYYKSIAVISCLGYLLVFSGASTGAQFIQTIDASAFNPPSPDTAGIAWLQNNDTLMASDSEVNEIPTLFTGANLFEILYPDPSILDRTGTTCTNPINGTYSCEPTGVAYDPDNQTMFISDDVRDRIFEIAPGPDGDYGTADDVEIANFRIDQSQGGFTEDGEGITYCPHDQRLYIAGGSDQEVYILDRGPNGVFDGPPGVGGDDNLTQFDTAVHGNTDTEGIACDLDNPGHVYFSGEPDDTVYHTTTDGTLVRTITVLASARKLAGLTMAPGSLGAADPNPTLNNLYITDRGVDNNVDPDENDGMIYEYSVECLPPCNVAPVVNAGEDQTHTTATLPVVANLAGTVTDDGEPDPPGMVTATWTQVSGPPAVIADPMAPATTVTLPAYDTYRFLLTGDDSELQSSEEMMITVQEDGMSTVYISHSGTANPPGLSFRDEDIAAFDLDTQTWSMYFDGSDVGFGGGGDDVNAFLVMADGSILFTVKAPATLPDVGAVTEFDIVRFVPTSTGDTTAGTYEWYFDGSDVGLGDSQGEPIDAIGLAPDGRLVISTQGNVVVGSLSQKDEDMLDFTFTQGPGQDTNGTWAVYFDGSDVELKASKEDINGAWIDDTNGDVYLSTYGNFNVTGASGDGLDIFLCTLGSVGPATSCNYSFFFDGSANGLPNTGRVDGFSLSR